MLTSTATLLCHYIFYCLQFARQLVRLNFSQVCLLHGGAGILRSQGLLSSLQDSL